MKICAYRRGFIFSILLFLGASRALADIVVLNEDQAGDYTFQSTNTYYITNVVTIYGTTTFEGGTVVKYGPDSALSVYAVDCETTSNNPAIFTARDDDAVGEILPDSQHVPPLAGYADWPDWWSDVSDDNSFHPDTVLVLNTDETALQHIKISYAQNAIWDTGSLNFSLDDADIRDCSLAIYAAGSDDFTVSNSKISYGGVDGGAYGGTWINVIFNHVSIWDDGYGGDAGLIQMYGCCILANTWIDGDSVTSLGSSNAFFNSDLFGDNYQILNLHAPTAYDQTIYTGPNIAANVYLSGYSPDSKPLTYIVIGSPLHGLLSGTPPNLTYTPNTDYIGPDSFTFTVDDGILDSTNATVSIAVDEQVLFFAKTPGFYVNSNSMPWQINVLQGAPFYQAILVDNTNMAAATWSNYISSNLTVNLGTNEGWHEVRIGLKSWSSQTDPSWDVERVKLNFTTPQLFITNPTNYVLSQPIIQLAGYTATAFESMSYDLSNSVKVVTNQYVSKVNSFFDTNLWETTSNYFQCYDLALAQGTNNITLYVADPAGNIGATNFTLVVDYSSRTNPPVIQEDWPQNGDYLSGTNFTVNGKVDDPSTAITASVVNADGETNNIGGLVGRDGNYYISNVPLGDGTNYLTLAATDVMGNTTMTNLTVMKSLVVVTINPVAAGDTVASGTINTNNCTVWVNGVQATLDGDNWSAAIQPFDRHGGTIDVVAVPNGGGQ